MSLCAPGANKMQDQDLGKIAIYFETLRGDSKTLVRLQYTLKPYVVIPRPW